MNNRYSLLFYLPLFLAAAVVLFTNNDDKKSSQQTEYTINKILGDASYVAYFGKKPDRNTSEQRRIRTHLLYVEDLLRKRSTDHLSPTQKRNRSHNLNLLRQYIQSGEFPHNDGHPDERRPTFIDDQGNICAVGYLVEKTAGRNVAESLNRKYKYAFIPEIDDPKFKEWAHKSGFSIKELAMIQPAYSEKDDENINYVEPAYSTGTLLLTSYHIASLSSSKNDPLLFGSAKTKHWFGIASGAGSVILGALNLDNSRTKYGYAYCCTITPQVPDRVNDYEQTNTLRSGISITNIALGLTNMIRSAYYLIKQPEPHQQFSKTQVDLTQIKTTQTSAAKPVPALKFKYNF